MNTSGIAPAVPGSIPLGTGTSVDAGLSAYSA
jgi:hypothetical protein